MKKYSYLLIQGFLILGLASCSASSGGFAPGEASSITGPTITPTVPVIPNNGSASFALVYGSSSSDRTYLADRIAGYQAPGLSVVFGQWRRFAGGNIYNSLSDIVQTPSYCFSGFDSSYNWITTTNPGNGAVVVPGTYSSCVNSDPFVASSWSYIASPDRIYNAANGTNFNGFISALKFSKFDFSATLYSAGTDDDAMGLIIAAVIDSGNNVHTLTAMRSQGGMVPTQGWGVVYKINNAVVRTIDPKSVGGVNTNSGAGDGLGWNGRKSLVSVSRDGNMISAYASTWATGATVQTVDPASRIDIDLADPTLSLDVFQGEQYYGYGTISQLGATFSGISFTAPNSAADPTYIYDLMNNKVYYKDSSLGYILVNGAEAYSVLGYPITVINDETQRTFTIDSATSYTEL